ncbi:MAG: C25 family cysteine peptidase [Bacteroidales bacterium]|nr:C25 family cysteine peptidase [Bacteroidales bacterium]
MTRCSIIEVMEVDFHQHTQNASATGCEYLIVTPDGEAFQAWADSIRRFRNMQGIHTEVVTLSEIGANDPDVLEDYFNNAYNNWDTPPAAVYLLGDYGTNMENSVVSPIYDSYCVSDNIYADVSGNHMPDIVFARITANNEEQLEVMVSKMINYEKNPPVSFDSSNNPITALGWHQHERWFPDLQRISIRFLAKQPG